MIGNKIDILMTTSQWKLEDTFPSSQFVKDNFTKPFRLDHTRNGSGIILCVKNSMRAILLTNDILAEDIEPLFV